MNLTLRALLSIAILSTTTAVFENDTTMVTEEWVGLKNTIVQFDPYVSILDKGNPYRYTFSDLVQLLSKVATRFNKVLVQESETDLEKDLPTGLSMSSMAAAEYNRLYARSGGKLEVWLAYASKIPDYTYDEDEFIYHQQPSRVFDRMMTLAKQANTNAPCTVSTILVPYQLVLRNMHSFISVNNTMSAKIEKGAIKWGITMSSEIVATHPKFRKHIALMKPDIVMFALPPLPLPNQHEEHFLAYLDKLGSVAGQQVKQGFILNVPDTDANGNQNISRLVTTWKQVSTWAEKTGKTIVIQKAFDKPSADTIDSKTNGWWSLLESEHYKNVTDFQFEEKASIPNSRRQHEDDGPTSSAKLEGIKFNRNHVDVIFSLGRKKETLLEHARPEETDALFEKVGQKFEKVVVLLSEYSRQEYRDKREDLKRVGRLSADGIEATLIFAPSANVANLFKGSPTRFAEAKADYRQTVKRATTFIAPFVGNETVHYRNFLKHTLLESIDIYEDEYTFGYVFSASICSQYTSLPSDEATVVYEYMKSEEVQILVFYFEEDDKTVKLGVDRMFRQRVVVLEECRKLVSAIRDFDGVKLSFMMLHYATDSGFYQSQRDMKNFRDYWQTLANWAEETNSSIILNNAFDGYRYSSSQGQYVMEIGWWRYNRSEDLGKGRTDNITDNIGNVWIDKVEDFKLRFPEKEIEETLWVLQTDQIVTLGVIFVLGIVGIIIARVLLVRRMHSKDYISKSEIQEFLNGKDDRDEDTDQTEAQCVPYDKDRYEVNSNMFLIQEDRLLGRGEFGKVLMGSVQRNGEFIPAAVKTVNAMKAHKSALGGLLSEIKLLSYLGKHENITELLAANTSDLKNGKVYIFLELCELGSLQKYLRGMQQPITGNDYYTDLINNTRRKSELDERVDKYLDMVSRKGSVDDGLVNDMYRWSREICRGMEYLASKHVIHADLATRNVLLNSVKIAKICDFGLSRRMYNYTNYVKRKQEPLPWKWMAPESLRNLVFSEKSDVWAYGVTLWEIYSLAEQPYPGLAWHMGFADKLEKGLQLLEPKHSTNNMYWMMKECWQISPQSRPTFSDLLKMFT